MKKIFFLLTIVLFSFVFFGGICFAAGEGTALVQQYNAKYAAMYGQMPEFITINNENLYPNDTYAGGDYHLIVYGEPSKVTSSLTNAHGICQQSEDSDYDPRYLGFTKDGYPLTNYKFNDEFTPKTSMFRQPWIVEPWVTKSGWSFHSPNQDYTISSCEEAKTWIFEAVKKENGERFNDPFFNYYGSGFDNGTKNYLDYFAVVSPYTEYTMFQCVGWNRYTCSHKDGHATCPPSLITHTNYNSFTLPPNLQQQLLDLRIEITSTGYEGCTGSETGTFTAQAKVTLDDAAGWDAIKAANIQIPVKLISTKNSTNYNDTIEYIDFTKIAQAGNSQYFEIPWEKEDWSDNVWIKVEVNPLDVSTNQRVVTETKGVDPYANNHAEISIPTNPPPPPPTGDKIYKFFEYNYYPIQDTLVTINENYTGNGQTYNYFTAADANRLFSYKPNMIKIVTSSDTKRIEIKMGDVDATGGTNGGVTVILQDLQAVGGANPGKHSGKWDVKDSTGSKKAEGYVYYLKNGTDETDYNTNNNLKIFTEKVDSFSPAPEALKYPTGATPPSLQPEEIGDPGIEEGDDGVYTNVENPPVYKKTWIFDFAYRNYAIFKEPNANAPQYYGMEIRAFDHLNQDNKSKPEFTNISPLVEAETNPIFAIVNVRQIKLFNLRMTDCKDIYWKQVFNDANGSPKGRSKTFKTEPEKPPFDISKMPVATNGINKRLISKGYLTQFQIDSEGLKQDDDELIIIPSYWWYDTSSSPGKYREVDLYYDIPNIKVFNVPVIRTKVEGNGNEYIQDPSKQPILTQLLNNYTQDMNGKSGVSNNPHGPNGLVGKINLVKNYNINEFYKNDQYSNHDSINKIIENINKNVKSTRNYSYLRIIHDNSNNDPLFEKRYIDMDVTGSTGQPVKNKLFINGSEVYVPSVAINGTDNKSTDYNAHRNTWTFSFSLHPKTKAILKKPDPSNSSKYIPGDLSIVDPMTGVVKTAKPVTGAILVNFKILTKNSLDKGSASTKDKYTAYNYSNFETTWTSANKGNLALGKVTSDVPKHSKEGYGNTFFYNFDWSALDDYTMQQK